MFKRIGLTMAIAYGLIIITTIALLNVVLVYSFKESQLAKNETKTITYGNLIATITKDKMDDSMLLNEALRENSEHIDGRVLILNLEGTVLADKYAAYLGKQIKNDSIDRTIKQGLETIGYYTENDNRIMMVSIPIKDKNTTKGAVLISVSVDSILAGIEDLRKQAFILSILAGILAVTLSLFIGNRIAKPIEKLTKASEAIRQGKLDTRVNISRKDEIGKLAEAFNQMSAEIYSTDINRRRFISDVSHELKTPLTSIKALIESLISGEDDLAVYKEYLTDVNGEIDRLSALVKSLLNVTRLEEMEITREPVNLYSEIESVAKLLNPLLMRNNIMLANGCGQNFIIDADRRMLREILINLIDNSIKYGKEKGRIDISCGENGNPILYIKDNGKGIPEKDIPFIFDLFFRSDPSRSSDKGGRGIGLYIVKKIITLHGWTIKVSSKLGEGTEFAISFNE